MELDATNVFVVGGVLLIVGAGSWLFVGSFLVWALWQVALYYVVLVVVAVAMYGALFVAVRGEGRSSGDGPIER